MKVNKKIFLISTALGSVVTGSLVTTLISNDKCISKTSQSNTLSISNYADSDVIFSIGNLNGQGSYQMDSKCGDNYVTDFKTLDDLSNKFKGNHALDGICSNIGSSKGGYGNFVSVTGFAYTQEQAYQGVAQIVIKVHILADYGSSEYDYLAKGTIRGFKPVPRQQPPANNHSSNNNGDSSSEEYGGMSYGAYVGAIVGGTIGGIVLIGGIAFLSWYLVMKKKNKNFKLFKTKSSNDPKLLGNQGNNQGYPRNGNPRQPGHGTRPMQGPMNRGPSGPRMRPSGPGNRPMQGPGNRRPMGPGPRPR